MLRGIFGIAIIALTLVGCASAPGPLFQPLASSPGQAQVYIYKGPNQIGAAQSLRILLDNAEVGALQNNGYLPLTVSPGSHTITVRVGEEGSIWGFVPQHEPFSFNVGPNESAYVRVHWSASGGTYSYGTPTTGTTTVTTPHGDFVRFDAVQESEALPEIRLRHLSN